VHDNVLILPSNGIQVTVERCHRKVLACLIHGHQLKPDIKAWVVAVAASRRDLVVVRAVVLAAADVQKVVDDRDARTVHTDGRVAKTRFGAGLEIVAHEVVVMAHDQLLTQRTNLTQHTRQQLLLSH